MNQSCLLKSLEYTDGRVLKLDQRQLWMCFMHYRCEFQYKCQGDVRFTIFATENNTNIKYRTAKLNLGEDNTAQVFDYSFSEFKMVLCSKWNPEIHLALE